MQHAAWISDVFDILWILQKLLFLQTLFRGKVLLIFPIIYQIAHVVMREGYQVNSLSCIGMLPFIEGSLGDGTSGLVAVSHDSEEHA